MSYNGNGVFLINTAGQPVVAGTVISSTAFNALTNDLANGLTNVITKDGQTTPTANIPMGGFRITGLGAAVAATDAVRLEQLQGNTLNYMTVTGTDTLLGSLVPPLASYSTGAMYSFIVANTNTGAVTLNIDGLGAKNLLRNAVDPVQAGDLTAGNVVVVIYDGVDFQLISVGFGGGATGAGGDKIFIENGQTVTTSYSIPALSNAMSTGPITIDAGATVTIPAGSVWAII
jgi:hypothetical protein